MLIAIFATARLRAAFFPTIGFFIAVGKRCEIGTESTGVRAILKPISLRDFVEESNRIEGIVRAASDAEIRAHEHLLFEGVTISGLCRFVDTVQPGARLRDLPGLNVQVGAYLPPAGGPEIAERLSSLLAEACDPFISHKKYEELHPFSDGNGRSGRALWLWLMGGIRNAPLGFLHHWYYQSLQLRTDLRQRSSDR